MSSRASVLVVMATVLCPITFVFMAISFGTDDWLQINVDRRMLRGNDTLPKYDRYTHSRYRGLFRECYPGNDTSFLDRSPGVVDGFCFKVEYQMPMNSAGRSKEYIDRLHLLRLFLAFFIIALISFVPAFVFGLILCCWRISRWAFVAGLCAYISAFCVAAAMAFFHGAEYMERNKVMEEDFYKKWSETIRQATSREYGWSYATGWVSMVLAALTATFFSMAGCFITSRRYEDRERLAKDYSYRSGPGFPIAMEPVYAVEDPYLAKPMYAISTGSLNHPRAYRGPYLVSAGDGHSYGTAYRESQRDHWTMREVSR